MPGKKRNNTSNKQGKAILSVDRTEERRGEGDDDSIDRRMSKIPAIASCAYHQRQRRGTNTNAG